MFLSAFDTFGSLGTVGGESQPPGWVLSQYGLLNPDLAFDFTTNLAWTLSTKTESTASSLLTTTRASTAFMDDNSGNWTSFGSNILRQTNKGTLIEEARTNSIRNNSMQGAVAGSPGTMPTNWVITNGIGLTTNVIGTGTQNGIDYVDLQITGTSTGTQYQLATEAALTIAASNGQTWANSVFAALVGGSLSNVTTIQQQWNETDGANVFLTAHVGSDFKGSLPGSLDSTSRFSFSATNSNASTAFIRPLFNIVVSNSSAINFTLRIGWPQLELGSFASSPIRTTNAAAARAADVVTVTSPPSFGSASTQFVSGMSIAPTAYATSQTWVEINNNNNGTTKGVVFRESNTGKIRAFDSTNSTGNTVVSPSVLFKAAYATASADQALSLNGAAVTTSADTWPATSTANTMQIGNDVGSTQFCNGYIVHIALWASTRLTNTQLQTIST